jgi:hypothetical protein
VAAVERQRLELEQPQEPVPLHSARQELQPENRPALLQEPHFHPGWSSVQAYWPEQVQQALNSCTRSKQMLPKELSLLQKPVTFYALELISSRI